MPNPEQYTLWKPEAGTYVHIDDPKHTFNQLQRQVDACQIDSTWCYSRLGTRNRSPLKQLRDNGRVLDLSPAIAIVVSLEDLNDPKIQKELDNKRERLNRRGVKHRFVYRATTSAYDDGDDYAKRELNANAGETWLHDCNSVYLIGDGAARLLDSDTIASDEGLDKALLTPLRKHCLGDNKTAKPLRYMDWDGGRTHRDLPDEIRSVVNKEEVPRQYRRELNRAEQALLPPTSSPKSLIAMGVLTLLLAVGLGVRTWWLTKPTPAPKVPVVTATFLSEKEGVYELVVTTDEPNVAVVRKPYEYECGNESSIEKAWQEALREARSLKVKEADLPTTRPPTRCSQPTPQPTPQPIASKISRATRAIVEIRHPSISYDDRDKFNRRVYSSLQSLAIEEGALPSKLLVMSLEWDHVFVALQHKMEEPWCELFVFDRRGNQAQTLRFEHDLVGIRRIAKGDLEVVQRQASTLFKEQYWKSLIARGSAVPNLGNVEDIYLVGTLPRSVARLLGADNQMIDFLAPSSGLKTYTYKANPTSPDAELSPEEMAFAVGVMQELLRDVEAFQVFKSKKKRLFYSPNVEMKFAEQMAP